jgi:3-hydroxybutyryl-CoA dehydrogenase
MTRPASPFAHVGVVGAGAMGGGIAQVAAEAGCRVSLVDARAGATDAAIGAIRGRLDKRVESGRLAPEVRDGVTSRLSAVPLAALSGCDLVIEAIVEDLGAKIALFRELEGTVGERACLATNTSSLSITAIQGACGRPERVGGLHFFNPVPAMPLVEIIPGLRTAPGTTEALRAFALALGKTPVVAKDVPGFLVNLAGRAFTTEALHLWSEGVAAPHEIDAIMRECCGFRLGPFELMDLTGLDVNLPVSEIIHAGFYGDPRLKTVPAHRAMKEAGLLGRKTGRGFYAYDAAGKAETPARPANDVAPAAQVVAPAGEDAVRTLLGGAPADIRAEDDGTSPILVAVEGADATTTAVERGLDARRLVAVDALFATPKRVTLMTAPGADRSLAAAAAALFAQGGRAVSLVADSPGFVAQRILAMIVNLACDIAQGGVGAPADVDTAVKLGLAYPKGPLEWADALGAARVVAITERIRAVQGSERYRVSPWLRRRAQLGLSALAT